MTVTESSSTGRPLPAAIGRMALLALLLSGAPALACDAPVFARYRSQPPLLATTADTALQVAVHKDGCVTVRFPQHDVRAGVRTWQMPSERWHHLRTEIESSGVVHIEQAAVRQRLKAAAEALGKTTAATLYVTADENIIEFVLPIDTAGKSLRGVNWSGLYADQLNLPDDPDLVRIAALRDAFEDLAAETHAAGTAR